MKVGGHAFRRVEKSSERTGQSHKLAPLAVGLFPVISIKEQTFVIERPSGIRAEVFIDLEEPAIPPSCSIPATPASLRKNEPPFQVGAPELTDKDEGLIMFEVERVVAHAQDLKAPAGHLLYQVKWFEYSERT